MSASLRPYDSVGRYGGEEFLLVLPGSDGSTTLEISERVRQAIGDFPMHCCDQPSVVTASFGATATNGQPARDVDHLIRVADQALYRAKRLGRNRVELAPETELAPCTC
jgi:diguanylate cyclase (GGDEF)-like protein